MRRYSIEQRGNYLMVQEPEKSACLWGYADEHVVSEQKT